ncbi:MAG: dihydroorotate dehydrogenase [Coriobacteriia bacterium]|nr:dihydroorotate dehydrogenase [Coriobacteriia bacterium]
MITLPPELAKRYEKEAALELEFDEDTQSGRAAAAGSSAQSGPAAEQKAPEAPPLEVDLRVRIGSLTLANPITTASGTFAAGREFNDLIDITRLGALTTKGVSATAWKGNSGRRLAETASGVLNSIGLQNPGVKHFIRYDLPWLQEHAPDLPVIVNVCGHRISDYTTVIERLEEAGGVAAYELNISCPNVDCGGMAMGVDPAAAAEVTTACRAFSLRPLIVKLTPNVTDITEVARAVEAAGADAVSLINTILGMAIDARSRKLVFKRGVAGLSGPAIKPVALRMVYEVAHAVKIPIIGMGGVATGTDVAEFMLAGATAVALGTANFDNPCATTDALDELTRYCQEQGVAKVTKLTGAVRPAS